MTQDQRLAFAMFAGYVVGAIVTAIAIRGLAPCHCAELELEEGEGREDA